MSTYSNRYLFRFVAQNGAQFSIYIKQRDYSGSCTQRALGQAPELRRDQGDHICGTSLTIYAECQTDQEFADLYTSDARKYMVELYHDGTTSTLMWKGFVTPELYAEPDIAPPYDVEIVATDGLGELKLKDWSPLSTKATLYSHITSLLENTGLSLSLNVLSTLRVTGSTAANFLSTVYVDLGHLVYKTCYEVLEALLTSLNAVITQHGAVWEFVRIADFAGSYTGTIDDIGSMDDNDFWPVGQLDTEVVPAKNKIIVQAPNFYKKSMLDNPDMTSDTGWLKYGRVSFYPVTSSRSRSYYELAPSTGSGSYDGEIFQAITFANSLKDLLLTTTVTGGSQLRIMVSYNESGTTYYLTKTGTNNTLADYEWSTTVGYIDIDDSGDLLSLEVYIPGRSSAGTLTVAYIGHAGSARTGIGHKIYASYLTLSAEYTGLQLNLNLGNNARNENDPVELSFSNYGDSTSNTDIEKYQNGVPTISNTPALNWQTNLLAAQSYIGFAGMDLALLNALPRMRKRGKVFIPASAANRVPMAFTDGTLTYIVEKYDYDLYTSELDLEMITLPATSLTISSQTYTALVEETSGSSSKSSGGGGGSGGSGTVTSVAITVPSGFSVTGSPVTTAGTIAITLDSSRVLLTATEYLKLQISAMPKLVIRRGYTRQGDMDLLYVQHDLLTSTSGAEAVLMIYRKHNGSAREISDHRHKKGWAVAKGRWPDRAGCPGLTINYSTKYFDFDDLRDYLIKYFTEWAGKTEAELRAMTYSSWENDTTVAANTRGFLDHGAKKSTLRLGIAIRVPNPAFVYSGTLEETTQEIQGQPRYLYSPVAELRASLVSDANTHNNRCLHFGMP